MLILTPGKLAGDHTSNMTNDNDRFGEKLLNLLLEQRRRANARAESESDKRPSQFTVEDIFQPMEGVYATPRR